jgi:hypothetical protein
MRVFTFRPGSSPDLLIVNTVGVPLRKMPGLVALVLWPHRLAELRRPMPQQSPKRGIDAPTQPDTSASWRGWAANIVSQRRYSIKDPVHCTPTVFEAIRAGIVAMVKSASSS